MPARTGTDLAFRMWRLRDELVESGVWDVVRFLFDSELGDDPDGLAAATTHVEGVLRDRTDLPDQVEKFLNQLVTWARKPDRDWGHAKSDVLTPNQVVAYNLWAKRKDRGWSQEEFGRRLEPHLGQSWSRAKVSAAEASVQDRKRVFTADEIFAFGRVFNTPPWWFFLPPPPPLWGATASITTNIAAADHLFHPARGLTPEQVWEFAEGRDPEAAQAVEDHRAFTLDDLREGRRPFRPRPCPREQRSEPDLAGSATAVIHALRELLGEHTNPPQVLRQLADILEQVPTEGVRASEHQE